MNIVKQALENRDLLPLAPEYLHNHGMEKAADMFDKWHDSLYNYQNAHVNQWKRLRTTNVLERVNLEIKRRTKRIGAHHSE